MLNFLTPKAFYNERYHTYQTNGTNFRPLSVKSSLIVIFYVIFLMRYAVIINYYLFWKNIFFQLKENKG